MIHHNTTRHKIEKCGGVRWTTKPDCLKKQRLCPLDESTMRHNYSQLTRVFLEDDSQINKKLPKELLLRIFSWLDVVSLCRCAQVSKAWNILALDGSNWQRIDLFEFQRDVEGPVIENISRRCGGFLRKLSLRGCQSIADGSMRTLAQQCTNIEQLNLNDCKKITDSTCEALSRYCRKLTRLDVGSCCAITDVSLKSLADGCRNLTHINISWCENITENGVEALARGCSKLKSFTCKGCLQVTDRAVSLLAQYCTQLEIVNLHGCSNVEDTGVTRLAQNCPKLHNLCISGCVRLTDVSLAMLATHCHLLSTLEVAGCTQFTDAGFQALSRSCRLLEKMDLEECVLITDATLIHLAMGCPRLEKLSLSHCELITDDGIRHLGTSPCASEHLTVLELDNCPLITDTSLEHLISCHNLQRIELYDCQLITRVGIRRLRVKALVKVSVSTPNPAGCKLRNISQFILAKRNVQQREMLNNCVLPLVLGSCNFLLSKTISLTSAFMHTSLLSHHLPPREEHAKGTADAVSYCNLSDG